MYLKKQHFKRQIIRVMKTITDSGGKVGESFKVMKLLVSTLTLSSKGNMSPVI